MADIQKKIKLDFAAEGLDKISAEMEKMGPLLDTSKEGKKLLETLKTEILQLKEIGGEAGFELGSEAATQFKKDYISIINDFQKLRSFVAVPLDPELEKRRLELAKLISTGEAQISALKDELDLVSEKIDINSEGKAEASLELKESILESKKEMDGLLTSFGKVTTNFETWNKSAVKFQEALKELGLEGIRNQKDIDKLSDTKKAQLEEELKKRKVY